MAVVFQAVGTAVSATTGTLTVAWPTHAIDDVALLWVTSSGGGTTETLATANGFTLINTQTTGTGTAGTKLSVYWARATSSAMAAPVVTAGTDFKYGVITTYRGVMTGVSPVNAFAGAVKATASTAATLPAVTTTVADAMVVLGISSDVDAATAFLTSTTNANLTSKAERFDAGTVSGLGGGIAVTDGIKATAATTGTTAAVVVSSINAMITVALTPALVTTGTLPVAVGLTGVAKTTYTPPATNLQYQYRAEDITGVTSGAGLATWAPTVGTGSLTQATGANQPTWVAGAINGRAVVRWPDAANALFMTGTTTADAQPATIVTVLKGGTTIDLQQIQPWHWGVEMHAESGFWKIYAGTSLNGAASSVDDAAWVVITAVYNGTTSAIYKNGTLIASGPAGATGVGTALNMGRHSNGTRNWRGDIAEVLRYDGALTEPALSAVHSYVQTMYGITVERLPITETWTGADGAPWDSTKWTLIGGAAPDIQGNRGHAGPSATSEMLLTAMPSVTDVDVTFTVRMDTVTDQNLSVSINALETYAGYQVNIDVDASYRMYFTTWSTADVYWDATGTGLTFAANTDYAFRVKRFGDTVYFKWWLGAGAEPSTWTYSAVDTDPLPAGKVVVSPLNGPIYIDNLTVAASTAEPAATTGTLPVTVGLTGTASTIATTTGSLPVTVALTGSAIEVGVSAGTIPVTVGLTGTATTIATATGTLPVTAGLTGTAIEVGVTTGTLPAVVGLTGTAVEVGVSAGTLPLVAGLTGSAVTVLGTTGILPVTVGLTGTASSIATATGSLPATAGLTGAASTTYTTTGALPTTVGLTGAATSIASTTGSLPTTVGITGTAAAIVSTTGALGVDTGLTGTASTVATTTGELGVTIGLEGTHTAILSTIGEVPVTVGLQGEAVRLEAGTADGQLPIHVDLTGTATTIATTTGHLPLTVGLEGAAETVIAGATTGALPALVGLTGTAGAIVTTTGSLPISIGLQATATQISYTTGTFTVIAGLSGSATNVSGYRDIDVTGALDPRRWGATLTAHAKTGALAPQRWDGDLTPHTKTGTLNDRRWKAGLQ